MLKDKRGVLKILRVYLSRNLVKWGSTKSEMVSTQQTGVRGKTYRRGAEERKIYYLFD